MKENERSSQKGTETNNPEVTTAAYNEIISSEIRWNNVAHLRNGAEDDRKNVSRKKG